MHHGSKTTKRSVSTVLVRSKWSLFLFTSQYKTYVVRSIDISRPGPVARFSSLVSDSEAYALSRSLLDPALHLPYCVDVSCLVSFLAIGASVYRSFAYYEVLFFSRSLAFEACSSMSCCTSLFRSYPLAAFTCIMITNDFSSKMKITQMVWRKERIKTASCCGGTQFTGRTAWAASTAAAAAAFHHTPITRYLLVYIWRTITHLRREHRLRRNMIYSPQRGSPVPQRGRSCGWTACTIASLRLASGAILPTLWYDCGIHFMPENQPRGNMKVRSGIPTARILLLSQVAHVCEGGAGGGLNCCMWTHYSLSLYMLQIPSCWYWKWLE